MNTIPIRSIEPSFVAEADSPRPRLVPPQRGRGRTPDNRLRRRRIRLLRLGAPILVFAIFSCPGLTDRTLTSITPRALEDIKSMDLALLEYRFTPDTQSLETVEERCKALLDSGLPNREYRAEVLGLMGTALFYKGDAENASRTAALIDRESQAEPRLYTIRALLARDRDKKIKILTDGLDKVERTGLVHLALAELWFDAGEYRKALAAFDQAFLALPPRYRELYRPRRDMAFQFMDNPPGNADTREILAKPEITVGDVIVLTARETRYFESVTSDPNLPAPSLYALLLAKGYLREGGPSPVDPMPRKDIAYLLVRVLAFLENDPGLLARYGGSASLTAASPVPDIQPTDYFYNAALVLVEREIMSLPDGKNFFPGKAMSGADYYAILKKLKSLYR
ncbi:MAG: hypothetical protein JXD23_11770 [Spirochaetales bacterium]|nr:hypothetical protein [Spirochaetales bacterium]